jgi:multidrug efflux pump subunit AcrB
MLLGLALIVAVVAVLGFYLGWVHFSSSSDGGSARVTVSVDKDQIQEDTDKAVDTVQDLGQQAKDEVAPTTQNTPE